MKPSLRKFVLTAHVTSSVGWLGAVLGYIALAVAAISHGDAARIQGAFVSMETIGWFVLVPCSLATLVTGLVQSLGTEWGLVRHWWVLAKFALTVPATAILLLHLPTVSRAAAEIALPEQRAPFMVHAVGGAMVLLAATVLSIYTSRGARQASDARDNGPPVDIADGRSRRGAAASSGCAPAAQRHDHQVPEAFREAAYLVNVASLAK